MKISKLFHWLYAILMLMPIFAIGVSCLYVIFNKNAKDSYYGETINQEINVNVDSDELVLDNTYFFTTNTDTYEYNIRAFIYATNIVDLSNNQVIQADSIQFSYGNSQNYLAFYNGSNYVSAFTTNGNSIYSISFEFVSSNNIDYFPFQIQEKQYNKYSYLDNVFYYSIEQLKDNQLFNWSKNSFLSQPITYITDLFGMDNDNIVIYLLSYWLDISIIWLVFDLVMYVPLLVHRWVDKGVLE